MTTNHKGRMPNLLTHEEFQMLCTGSPELMNPELYIDIMEKAKKDNQIRILITHIGVEAEYACNRYDEGSIKKMLHVIKSGHIRLEREGIL